MNVYFLVEGDAEARVYPKWIDYFLESKMTRCAAHTDVVENNYILVNGQGRKIWNSVRSPIKSAIAEINTNPVFNYLVIVVDADYKTIADRTIDIQTRINEAPVPLPANCELKIIIQNRCFETWFCGHTDNFLIAKASTNKNIRSFVDAYDIEILDPELMQPPPSSNWKSIGQYHFNFLHHMLMPVASLKYSKSSADKILDIPYLERLIKRKKVETPSHLPTFDDILILFDELKQTLNTN
jgi:hypothetical protein